MNSPNYDIILVGGGVMGCATAYYLLKADKNLNVAIVEMDPTYEHASTTLSDGNHRVQFNVKANIEISLYGLQVLDHFSEEMAVDGDMPDVAFRQQGNLFLVDDGGREEAVRGLKLQQSLGCLVEWFSSEEVLGRFPLLSEAAYVAGTFGIQDGTMNPSAVLMGYKNKALSMGAQFIQAQVTSLLESEKRISGVLLSSGEQLNTRIVVNSAGAWGALLAQTVGIDLPVEPIKRQVFVLDTLARPEGILPAIFFPSGMYLIHEHDGHFMCGKSLTSDPVGFEFNWEKRILSDQLWPELVEHVPSFDRLKVVSGWAGLYAVNTFDGNAILGEWPELPGAFLMNGFSGHGFQQCHAAGRYIAELILGQTPILDLSIFSPARIIENKPVFESERRLI